MIISPPILKPQTAQQTDEAWVDSIMSPKSATDGEFPITDKLAWHGGYHLGHTDNNAMGNPIRAIADGVVVYARASSGAPAIGIEPLNYNNHPTDDGCVVIQHTTEIGDQVSVTYYSVYMHMRKETSYEGVIRKGKKVYRKQEIGLVGQAHNENMIHMEIVCDQENLEKLVGRNTPELDLNTAAKGGRTSVVYGDIHFYLPEGTKFYAEKNTTSAVTPSQSALFVTLNFNKGDAQLTTRKETKEGSGIYIVDATAPKLEGYEYNLYKNASLLKTPTVAHSAAYELLRFGRILDTAVEPSDMTNVEHWHKVYYNGGSGYVNLNAANVKVYSDGDFPHWMGWRLIDDDPTLDSQCNSPILNKWLDTDCNSKNTHVELAAALNDATVQASLSKTICNFPTEWAKSLIDTQYSWLTSPSDALSDPLTPDDYAKFKAHVTALSFWEEMQVSATGALPPTKHWHFHPGEFIKHFRKCGWLSENEMLKCISFKFQSNISNKNTPITLNTVSTSDAKNRLSKINRDIFLKMCRKYGIYNVRLAHFLAQVYQETGVLRLTQELASGSEYEGRIDLGNTHVGDGIRFKGRGLIQTTGYNNYQSYSLYRGKYSNESYLHEPNNFLLTTDAYNVSDTAGLYWISRHTGSSGMNINRKADLGVEESNVRSVTKNVNGAEDALWTGLVARRSHLKVTSQVLLDGIDAISPAQVRTDV